MKYKRVVMVGLLLAGMMAWSGCALFLVGAAAGAGAAGVSYAGNELRATQEVSVDRAWAAGERTLTELQFPIIARQKDATGGTLSARNAKDQPIKVSLIRQSDRLTEIRVRVGTFDTTANRTTAQLIWDKLSARLK